jgi:hypothetical protein
MAISGVFDLGWSGGGVLASLLALADDFRPISFS